MKRVSGIGRPGLLAVHLFLIVLVGASILPLYNVVSASLKSSDEFIANPFLLPIAPTAQNYGHAAIQARLLAFAVNSLVLVPSGLLLYIIRLQRPRATRSAK
ncbi:MAG: hypothetical protein HC888_13130 [Candidatus Competibacteraceae bacterium]|nr:hypothetical protein [Candidatus Competibacteraceae bacterium]